MHEDAVRLLYESCCHCQGLGQRRQRGTHRACAGGSSFRLPKGPPSIKKGRTSSCATRPNWDSSSPPSARSSGTTPSTSPSPFYDRGGREGGGVQEEEEEEEFFNHYKNDLKRHAHTPSGVAGTDLKS